MREVLDQIRLGSNLLVFLALVDDAADIFIGVILIHEDSCTVERLN
jgi:hypothetical protein